MYYFDNAATSWPKPASVITALTGCISRYGANPNRGGYSMARDAGHLVLEARRKLCTLFNTDDPFEYAFTHNTTAALNYAIKGILKPGMHAVATALEHNSVLRPLFSLREASVDVDIAAVGSDGIIAPEKIRALLKPNTRLVIVTHASNAVGTVQPIEEIISIAHQNGSLVLVDAAQSAGCIPLDIKKINADMVAMPGHKGLYGVQGTGVLYVKKGTELEPVISGGTGSESKLLTQPSIMPDKLEAGTINTPGIAALGKGIEYITARGITNIMRHEAGLAEFFYNEINKLDNVKIYGTGDLAKRCPIVTFNIDGIDASSVESILDKKYNIAVRSGLHCAPLAHKAMGTYDTGAVRFSFGAYNDERQTEYAVKCIRSITERYY